MSDYEAFARAHQSCQVNPWLVRIGHRFGSELFATFDGGYAGHGRLWCNGCRADIAIDVKPHDIDVLLDIFGVRPRVDWPELPALLAQEGREVS